MILLSGELTKVRCKRAGIIPYVKMYGDIYFLMGVDRKTGELSDFGGGIAKNESILIGAIREFMEETKQILDPSHLAPVACAIFDQRNDMCILFCKIIDTNFFYEAKSLFATSNIVSSESDEMSDIMWVSKTDMIRYIYSVKSILWNRIKYVLNNGGNFNDELLKLL